eukprot:TRINITY_DN11950_c0_g1_i1.p1 TRINITY_DN11950_c0_g1~~TRINITY_DN11950_c0_g1_i1.p1  ORF type:complete len:302 (+),score=39.59 TRINITY_DN11950_c0_g1_i1:29-907(+)
MERDHVVEMHLYSTPVEPTSRREEMRDQGPTQKNINKTVFEAKLPILAILQITLYLYVCAGATIYGFAIYKIKQGDGLTEPYGMRIWGPIFGGFFLLGYIYICSLSPLRRLLSRPVRAKDYLQTIHSAVPKIYFVAHINHCTDASGAMVSQSQYDHDGVQANRYDKSEMFRFASYRDVSEPVKKRGLIWMTCRKSFVFANPQTQAYFEAQKQAFQSRFSAWDRAIYEIDFEEIMEIPGIEDSLLLVGGSKPCSFNNGFYFIFCAFFLAFPFTVMFGCASTRKKYTVVKELSI